MDFEHAILPWTLTCHEIVWQGQSSGTKAQLKIAGGGECIRYNWPHPLYCPHTYMHKISINIGIISCPVEGGARILRDQIGEVLFMMWYPTPPPPPPPPTPVWYDTGYAITYRPPCRPIEVFRDQRLINFEIVFNPWAYRWSPGGWNVAVMW